MDDKTNLITSVMTDISESHQLDTNQMQSVQNILYLKLNNYDVHVKCTDLAEVDNTSISYLKKFVATKRMEGLSEKSIEQYILRCSHMIYTVNKPIDEIDAYDLRFYLSEYKEQNNISNRTLDNIRNCLSSFFKWLNEENMIPNNPMKSVKCIKYEKKIRYPFSATEMEKLRKHCTNRRDRAIIEFLYATGCRASEALKLNQDDINWQERKVSILGKGNKERTIYISDTALFYLKEYLRTRKDSSLCLFACLRRKGDGERMRLSISGLEYMLKQLGERAGVENVHPHRFRRTFATNMINKGAPIQDVAIMLGHANIDTTMIYYYSDDDTISQTYQKYAR